MRFEFDVPSAPSRSPSTVYSTSGDPPEVQNHSQAYSSVLTSPHLVPARLVQLAEHVSSEYPVGFSGAASSLVLSPSRSCPWMPRTLLVSYFVELEAWEGIGFSTSVPSAYLAKRVRSLGKARDSDSHGQLPKPVRW